MSLKNTAHHYGSVARFFHWTTFFLILISYGTMIFVEDLPEKSDWISIFYTYHKSVGVLILALVTFRILWRFSNVVPKPAAGLHPMLNLLANSAHYLLYLAMILLPVSGLIFNKYPINFFYMIEIPLLPTPFDPEAKKIIKLFHEYFAWFILGVIGIHILAALWHHFIRKDDILKRMLKG